MSLPLLLNELERWCTAVGRQGIASKSAEWHRKLAMIFKDSYSLRTRLQCLPIIALRFGQWCHAATNHLYLAADDDFEHIPNGVNIYIVDREMSNDPIRRQFLHFLGINPYSPRELCSLIIELHRCSNVPSLSEDDWIGGISYLYKYRSLLRYDECINLWFLKESHGTTPGRLVKKPYFIDPDLRSNIIRQYKITHPDVFVVIDDRYERQICGNDNHAAAAFRRWLREDCRLPSIPTLASGSSTTREWDVIEDTSVTDLLLLLKEKWASDYHAVRQALSPRIGRLRVRCTDEAIRRLAETAVPTPPLLQACPHLPFVVLPGGPTGWHFLGTFGVMVAVDTTARLGELSAIRLLPAESADRSTVHDLYRGLNAVATPASIDSEKIR